MGRPEGLPARPLRALLRQSLGPAASYEGALRVLLSMLRAVQLEPRTSSLVQGSARPGTS